MNIDTLQENGNKILSNIEKVIVGKRDVIRLLLAAFLSEGHVLLEDMPGTGKTKLAKSMAVSLGGEFSRIQFTPDLLPGDVTGMNIFNRKTNEFELRKGPVFTNILLADEINRATPRTQSGLLESMEERQVTIDGEGLILPKPFFVIATQNPIETAGTFPLPEAQLDRFMMKLTLGLPTKEEEILILERFHGEDPFETLTSVVTLQEIAEMKAAIQNVFVHKEIEKYIVAITAATREKDKVVMGVSPRAAISLMKATKAYAALNNRGYCIPDDVKALAGSVLAHRLKLSYGNGNRKEAENVIAEILEEVVAPTEDWGLA